MGGFLENLPAVIPAVGIGALIPLAAIVALLFLKDRKEVPFSLIFYGFASFFATILMVALSVVLFASTVSIGSVSATDGDRAVMTAGTIVLLLFYLISELFRYITYKSLMKKEKKGQFGGLLFGAGFILAQDLLVLGIALSAEFDVLQGLGFGILMLICGLMYLLISEIGYQTTVEGHPFVGGALASVYFLLFAVMLLFSKMTATYVYLGLALIFLLVMGYVLLPLPFSKKGGAAK